MLYHHLRIHQIFGANTNVGKTVTATALCRATANRSTSKATNGTNNTPTVFYLKPVSTGPLNEADDR